MEVAEGAEPAVLNLASLLVGPLAGPECRRAVARGWLILLRTLAAGAVMGVVLVALWLWWINQRLDPFHRPYYEFRVCLVVVEGMLVTVALVMGPAVLAGSLAGERERGALALLLTTRVSAREIVIGRLSGKLAQVGMILLAGVPAARRDGLSGRILARSGSARPDPAGGRRVRRRRARGGRLDGLPAGPRCTPGGLPRRDPADAQPALWGVRA